MKTAEHLVKPEVGNSNTKALVALGLSIFALANVILTALIFVFWSDEFADSALWMVPPLLAVVAGTVGAFLGTLGWIDVRRGLTDRRLVQAKLGSLLGGFAAGLVFAAIALAGVLFVLLMVAFGAYGSGGWD